MAPHICVFGFKINFQFNFLSCEGPTRSLDNSVSRFVCFLRVLQQLELSAGRIGLTAFRLSGAKLPPYGTRFRGPLATTSGTTVQL